MLNLLEMIKWIWEIQI